MKVEVVNLTGEKVLELEEVGHVLEKAVEKENLGEVIFNVVLVNDSYIQNLNKTYRGIDRVTDVITFALEDEKKMVSSLRVLGDIYICLDQAKRQKELYGHSLLRELSFLAVHGFYHLLGYDHQTEKEEKIMFAKQEEILNLCNIQR